MKFSNVQYLLLAALHLPTYDAKIIIHKTVEHPYIAAVADVSFNYDFTTVKKWVEHAQKYGAQIISFPENGPQFAYENSCNASRSLQPNHSQLPYPSNNDISGECRSYCLTDNKPSAIQPISCFAKLAKESKMYISVNTVDQQPCIFGSNVTDLCINRDTYDAYYAFNANAIFSPEGALIAKYYKRATFGAGGYDVYKSLTQTTPVLTSIYGGQGRFTTNFNVTFASAICNDVNDRGYLESLKNDNITDLIYGNSYENIISLETIGATLTAISYFYSLNIIGASTGLRAAGGSGIYSNGRLLSKLHVNTNLKCVRNLANTNPSNTADQCAHIDHAKVMSPPPKTRNPPPPPKTKTEKGKSAKTSKSKKMKGRKLKESSKILLVTKWKPKKVKYSVALHAPDLMSKTFENESVLNTYFEDGSPEHKIANAMNQVARTAFLPAPVNAGTYEAELSYDGIVCKATLDFPQSTSTSETVYTLTAYSGKAIFPNTPCPDAVSFCSLARCLKFQNESGACIPVQGIDGAPHPRQSEAPTSITISGTFSAMSYPEAIVTDNALQPVDMHNLILDGSFKYEDYSKNPTGNTTHTLQTHGDNAFVTLLGVNPLNVPSECNACSAANDLYKIEDSLVTDTKYKKYICSQNSPNYYPSN